jgi:hypothetical protein
MPLAERSCPQCIALLKPNLGAAATAGHSAGRKANYASQ